MAATCTQEYEFTLVLSGIPELTADVEDALFEAGCDDATISVQSGAFCLEFCRESTSFFDAILSAIHHVCSAKINAVVVQVDECNLVTQAEIARRCGRTRQLISQYMTGKRGPGRFPPPSCHLNEKTPLWRWCEVSYWLFANDMIRPEVLEAAEIISAVNNFLEHSLQERRNRGVMERVSTSLREVCAC